MTQSTIGDRQAKRQPAPIVLLLFVVPFYAIAAVAFGQVDPILRTADEGMKEP